MGPGSRGLVGSGRGAGAYPTIVDCSLMRRNHQHVGQLDNSARSRGRGPRRHAGSAWQPAAWSDRGAPSARPTWHRSPRPRRHRCGAGRGIADQAGRRLHALCTSADIAWTAVDDLRCRPEISANHGIYQRCFAKCCSISGIMCGGIATSRTPASLLGVVIE